MMILPIALALWLFLSICAGIYADTKGHSFVAHILGALIFSPVLVLLVIAVSPDKVAEKRHQELLEAARKQ